MDFAYEFIELMIRFRKLKVFEFPGMDNDLTLAQLRIIGFVHNNGTCRTQDIADGIEITAPTASVAVNKLAALGWLEKNPDPDDGRATLISLAAKASDTFRKIREKRISGIQRLLVDLSSEEQKTLLDLLSRIVNSNENKMSGVISGERGK
jgi:DNA-binding MarR family transcriptional regulator